ncbi:hypothetical protein BMR1_01G03145 [Babesia microti strain RI]|uniref:Uncharacterized protein n=1 Tax=Babesia microti (strain RI) TaxID=1133968 RepID=I7IPM9_BABMR|nr:hypothetical protein BMR1_01G03145 [Babesia microti strain RI]CCF73085.1 hypothetical protein BMR1_01G03145 [Babesia microti strain RI]|eukprot:XP_012647694.1 hypothetical protein BMR1_01G03145 [Babesia microti strain RI]
MKNKNCLSAWKKKKHGSHANDEDELVIDKSVQETYKDEIVTNLVDASTEQNSITELECKVPSCDTVLNVNATGTAIKKITDLTEVVLSKKISLNELDMSTISKYCADKFKYISSDNSAIPKIIEKLFSTEIKAGDEKLLRLEKDNDGSIEKLELMDITSPLESAACSKRSTDRIFPLSDESRRSATCNDSPKDPISTESALNENKEITTTNNPAFAKENPVKELPTLKTGIWFFDNINDYLDLWNDVVTGMNNNNLFKLLNLSALLRYFGDPAGNILLDKVCKSNMLPSDEPQKKSWKSILEKDDIEPTPTEMVPLPTFSNKTKHDRCTITARNDDKVNAEHYFKLYWESTEKWMMNSFGPNMTAISKLYVSTRQWFLRLTRPAQVMFIRLSNVFCTIPSSPRGLTFD